MNCMKKSANGFVLLICIFTLLISCKHELPAVPVINPPSGGGGGNGGGATDSICFEKDILPIFKNNCATTGCHNNLSHQKDYVLDSYDNIMKNKNGIPKGEPNNSDIYNAIIKFKHEDKNVSGYSPLTNETIILVKNWILDSAKNIPCGGTCETSNVTYTNTIALILETNCYTCHKGTAANGGGIPLDTYDGVKAKGISNQLYPAVAQTGVIKMPKGGAKLSDCNIAKIKKWIDEGYPN